MAQQARNAAWELEELKIPIRVLIHDRDSNYSSDFDTVFSGLASGSPEPRSGARVANAACERVLGSPRRECLDWLIILGERHLVQVLREYFDHYNRARPHRAPWASVLPSPNPSRMAG